MKSSDKEKLLAFAQSLRNILVPTLESAEAIRLSGEVVLILHQAADLIEEKSKKL